MRPLWIRGARALDPGQNLDAKMDLLVDEHGLIESLRDPRRSSEKDKSRRLIDAQGWWLMPGLIDLHVHLRQPGPSRAETISSGCLAAAAGGFTRIMCMPNTIPVLDRPSVVSRLCRRLEDQASIRVQVAAALSLDLAGRRSSNHRALADAGASALSDDGLGTGSARVLGQALTSGMLVMVHAEDRRLSAGGQVAAGRAARALRLPPWPAEAERVRVNRDIKLLRRFGGRLHFQHLSTRGALQAVRRAKEQVLAVSAEATPHHLFLTTNDLMRSCSLSKKAEPDPNLKMNPPLRGRAEQEALRCALADGTIDALATDHAPHTPSAKAQGFFAAPFGVIGLETALPLCLELAERRIISTMRALALLTSGPAKLLGVATGLRPGLPADLCLLDPKQSWTVRPEDFCSRSRNTAFAGRTLRGKVVLTLVQGEPVYATADRGW